MKFHVITVMKRSQNIEVMREMLRPKDVIWHIITDENDPYPYNFNEPDWIKHHVCPESGLTEHYERCYYALNYFLETHDLEDEDMYSYLADDDALEPTFYEKVKSAESEIPGYSIYLTSMERGHQTPAAVMNDVFRCYPPTKLVAAAENICVGGVGLEQIMIKGSILRRYRFGYLHHSDSIFISDVVHKYGALLIPDANVWFNYYEPGRWNY